MSSICARNCYQGLLKPRLFKKYFKVTFKETNYPRNTITISCINISHIYDITCRTAMQVLASLFFETQMRRRSEMLHKKGKMFVYRRGCWTFILLMRNYIGVTFITCFTKTSNRFNVLIHVIDWCLWDVTDITHWCHWEVGVTDIAHNYASHATSP